MRVLRFLGSLKLTFALLVVVTGGIVAGYVGGLDARPLLTGALALLVLNLLGAITTHPRFRRQSALLAFHLCLLAAMLLVAAGDLLRLEGRLELANGQAFAPELVQITHRGVWHPEAALEAVAFRQGRFTVDYAPGLVRRTMRSWVDLGPDGVQPSRAVVGSTQPLVQEGFRFYATSNKGLAALVTWVADRGEAETGTVHFPSWPLNDWNQVNAWTSPDGDALVLELTPDLHVSAGEAFTFDSDRVPAVAELRVRHAQVTAVMLPGQSLRLPGGRLLFHGLTTWMGYRVTYDPTLPWLLATGIVGALALGGHFLGSLAPVPRSLRVANRDPALRA